MPELPEIALYKKYIDSTSLNQQITEVEFPDSSLLQSPENKVKQALKNSKFKSTTRAGKHLFVGLESGKWLALHFGMTGKLEYFKDQDAPDYTKMLVHFANDYHLAFVCPRKLGKIALADNLDDFRAKNGVGKDALRISKERFVEILKDKRGSLKGALTDQKSIAGIGNVYADEIAFQTGWHPKTDVAKLSESDIEEIYDQTQKVLKTVIEKDAVRDRFPNSYLTPHRKNGAECPGCAGKVKQIKISGRSTYFCPECQKDPS